MTTRFAAVAWFLMLASMSRFSAGQETVAKPSFGIHVVDEQTGRGVPLVELRMVNETPFVTDSAGWIAFQEPDLMGHEVYFAVSGPGIEYPKDGFGYRGVRLKPVAGATATVKIKRTNIAERMYRVTGQGIYRDSQVLGLTPPDKGPQPRASVMGQDSIQTVSYGGKLVWLWGDTGVPNYPLGNFHMTGATTPLPGPKTFQPAEGIPLEYIMDEKRPNRVRGMAPTNEPGVVWLGGVTTISGPEGKEALVAHYSRRKGLEAELEQGLMRFDDEAGVFKKIATLEPSNTWRRPRGSALRVGEYVYFIDAFANTRMKGEWESFRDTAAYEAFAFDPEQKAYRWQRELPPTTQAEEQKLIDAGKLKAADAQYQIVAADGKAVQVHRSAINYNAFRKKWVMIINEMGRKQSPSLLGEVWYAEADAVTGPWTKAVKIVSHPRYTFYNPWHHVLFDEDGGRVIYFEATYTREFSGNPVATPRYDYNQLMYRLDLTDPRLDAVR